MTDYNALKVPDLKKLLSERGLVVSGNKADLIARLAEDDGKKGGAGGAGGEDEIDWDEDDNKATTAPAAAAIAAGGQGQVANPTAVPNQKIDTDPSKTSDLKVVKSGEAPTTTSADPALTEEPKQEAPKQDFTLGVAQTDAEKEEEKRIARAKRFGLPTEQTDEEEKKRLERAKKFGLDAKVEVVKGLDSALPERRPKRAREERGGGGGGRSAKRQTPDRRTGPGPKVGGETQKERPKAVGRITDDPSEKAKAEARAKRFQAVA